MISTYPLLSHFEYCRLLKLFISGKDEIMMVRNSKGGFDRVDCEELSGLTTHVYGAELQQGVSF